MTQDRANFLITNILRKRNENIGLAKIAVVFGNFIFQDEMIPEGIPGQIGNHGVILVPIMAIMRQYQVWIEPLFECFKGILDRRPLIGKIALAKLVDSDSANIRSSEKFPGALAGLSLPFPLRREYVPKDLDFGIVADDF